VKKKYMKISEGRVSKHRSVIITILKNIPTLDPMAILLNSRLYYLELDGTITAFITLKKMGSALELGTVYTHPQFRKKGYASSLIQECINHHHNSNVYVLCEKKLQVFYENKNFEKCEHCHWIINLRKKLFNTFLKPFLGYELVSLKTNKSPY